MAIIRDDGVNAIWWGGGRISRGAWVGMKKLLCDYEIRTLLEFGSGLSTELFSLENLDEFISCDVLKHHIDNMRKAIPRGTFIHYECESPPQFEGKQFDIVFLDGPTSYRKPEMIVSNRVARKVLLCHDWGRGQPEVKLDDDWVPITPNRLFVRQKYVSSG